MEHQGFREPSKPRRKTGARLMIALATVAACGLVAELGLRAAGRLPSNTTEGFFDQHGRSYRLKKNLTKIVKIPSYSFTLYTNGYGFRDEKTGPREIGPDPYVVFLGDSMTFANGVDYGQSFVGVFAGLAAKDGTGVLNMAVGGHHLQEQRDVFREFVETADRPPAKVVICFSPISIHGFDASFSDVLVKRGYLFPRRGWRLAYLRVLLGDSSSFYCYVRDNVRKIQAGLSNNRLLYAQAHLAYYRRDNALADAATVARFDAELAAFDDYLRGLGSAPVYVYLPASPDLKIKDFLAQTGEDPGRYDFEMLYRPLEAHCRARGIPLIDLRSLLKERYDAGDSLNFMLDAHYNPHANEIIGRALYQALAGRTEGLPSGDVSASR